MPEMVLGIKGLEKLEKYFAHAPQVVDREIDRAMQRSVQKLTTDVKVETPVDRGRLRSAIHGRVEGRGIETIGRVGLKGGEGRLGIYAKVMEAGARPHFPPLEALEVWARRHGMTAWQVAISIARKGIKGRYMFKNAMEKNRAWVEQEFSAVWQRVLDALG